MVWWGPQLPSAKQNIHLTYIDSFYIPFLVRKLFVPTFQVQNQGYFPSVKYFTSLTHVFCVIAFHFNVQYPNPSHNIILTTTEEATTTKQVGSLDLVYPKVKVRGQDQDDQYAVDDHERSSLLSLKALESLSMHDFCAPENYQDDSPPSIVRIPKSYIPNIGTPMISISEGAANNSKKIDEDNRPNIRASSVPPPRAVLSSPDNDGMIGSKNRIKAERPSALKNHNLSQNRHAQCKVIPSHINAESPINTRRKSKEAAYNKSDIKGKKGSVIAVPSQKAYHRTGKPSSVRI